MSSEAGAALERLIRIAADFLLAWCNAAEYGGFDLTELWTVDAAIAEDITSRVTVDVDAACGPPSPPV